MGLAPWATVRTPSPGGAPPPGWRTAVPWGPLATVVALHVVGWGSLFLLIAPAHLTTTSAAGTAQVFGVGLALTAYTLGMRHAFDADHIAAIDNTTRKLLSEGRRASSVGFWFSLGHSSIVMIMSALLALGVQALATQLGDDDSWLHTATGLIGPSVSGIFLLGIGAANLVALAGILRVAHRSRGGVLDDQALEGHLEGRGAVNRLVTRITGVVRTPGHMYGVGLLFGLGFDTATEIGLLALAGGAAAVSLPWYAVLTLPVLFAAGMTLLDTADGVLMVRAYGWALDRPHRKIAYNATVTGISVAVALGIGGIELAGVLSERLGLADGPVAALGGIDLDHVGYAVVALFAAVWLLALAVWRIGRRTRPCAATAAAAAS